MGLRATDCSSFLSLALLNRRMLRVKVRSVLSTYVVELRLTLNSEQLRDIQRFQAFGCYLTKKRNNGGMVQIILHDILIC